MATKTLPARAAIDGSHIELALQALNQVDALLPIAQLRAHAGGDDALLAMLGRIRQMNTSATHLLIDGDTDTQSERVIILGAAEVNHV